MSALVYLLRQPVSSLSSALFTSGEGEWTVVPIEETVSGRAPNYRDLLNVIINARKVIIL
jgi:hypothetical protein